ncbi:nucleolar protein [Malassezia pachydermatis]
MSSPYSFKPGGKKKKSSSSTDARELKATHRTSDDKMSGKDPASYSMQRARTKAEQKFEEVQRKRLHEQARKEAGKTHKDKVESFNAYLESLSEHHDMPKIGPG